LTDEGVPFDVYRSQDEFARFPLSSAPSARFSVFKIHGCLERPETIIATVETQARGLAEHQRFVLRWLQERYLGVWIKGLAGALLPRPTLKAASPDSERY
jgi:hypothetical protein